LKSLFLGKFFELNGLIFEPLVLGFNNGIILSELAYLNLKRISESVFSISKIMDGLVS